MDIQLFVSDLDGTLLTEHSQVAPETAQAIQCAQQAGIRWLTATGRSWNTAAPLLEQAGISCDFVLLNGAELRSAKGELLLDASLSTATARQAADILSKHGIGLEINTDQGDFTTDTQFCNAAPLPEDFASLSTATARQAADILSKHGIGLEINTDQGDFTTDTQFCNAAPLPEDFWSRPLTVRKLFGFLLGCTQTHCRPTGIGYAERCLNHIISAVEHRNRRARGVKSSHGRTRCASVRHRSGPHRCFRRRQQ